MVSSRLTLFLLLALAAASSWLAAAAFVVLPFVSSRVLQRAAASASAARAAAAAGRWRHQRFQQGRIEMRDASMVTDVAVGDRVRVKQGVVLDGRDWGGLEGTVAYVWEKCEVDPHCCCAELGTVRAQPPTGFGSYTRLVPPLSFVIVTSRTPSNPLCDTALHYTPWQDGPIRVDFQKVEQSSSDAAGKLGDHESDHNFFNEGELELVVFVARAAGAR